MGGEDIGRNWQADGIEGYDDDTGGWDAEVDKTDEAEGIDDNDVDRGEPRGEVGDEETEGRQVDKEEMDDEE